MNLSHGEDIEDGRTVKHLHLFSKKLQGLNSKG